MGGFFDSAAHKIKKKIPIKVQEASKIANRLDQKIFVPQTVKTLKYKAKKYEIFFHFIFSA